MSKEEAIDRLKNDVDYQRLRKDDFIKIKDCKKGRIYKIHSRNLGFGVFDGEKGFIGIREKFGDLYLFTEYHWDTGAPFGTVRPLEDTGIDLPEGMALSEWGDEGRSRDLKTKRFVEFKVLNKDGTGGWYFIDTGEFNKEIRPTTNRNEGLFKLLKKVKKEFKSGIV